MRMKTAVATLCVGAGNQAMRKLTYPWIIDYAERIGADFINIARCFGDRFLGIPNYEKLQCISLLDIYDRVIYLDSDIIVSPHCPNLFDTVPSDQIGAFMASRYTNLHNHTNTEVMRALGEIDWRRESRDGSTLESFNSGVLILSKPQQPALEQALSAAEIWCRYRGEHSPQTLLKDQPVLNYIVQKNKLRIMDITYRFNHTNARGKSPDRFASHMIHYAGVSHRQGKRLWKTSKLTKMRIDAAIFSSAPLLAIAKRWPAIIASLDSLA